MNLGKLICVGLLVATIVYPTVSIVAQDSQPQVTCVSVNPDGSTIVSWIDLGTPAPGTEYEVYRDQGFGFAPVETLSFPINQYNDPSAQANQGIVKYFVIDASDNPDQATDTVQTIFLELPSTGSSSVAQLDWNFPFEPMPSEGEFIIERSQTPDPYVQLATLPFSEQTFRDTLYGLCDSTDFVYRITYANLSCTMFSQELGKAFIDIDAPPTPNVETITVNPQNGDVSLFWDAIETPDLEQFVIQEVDLIGGSFVTVGVEGPGSNSFEWNSGAGAFGNITLAIRSEDSCDNEGSVLGTETTTIFTTVNYEECDTTAIITWTNYEGWDEGVEDYEIRAIVDNSNDILFASLSPDAFIHEVTVQPNTEYLFYVVANSNGTQRPSSSNGVELITEYPEIIDFHYQSSVSVTETDQIEVRLLQDVNGVGTTYTLFRAENQGSFTPIAFFSDTGDPEIVYLDTDVRPKQVIYSYFWQATDGCGRLIGDSNTSRNMVLLTRESAVGLFNQLLWSAYEGWDGELIEYKIWRSEGDEDTFQEFDVVDANEFFWEEDIEEFMMDEGRFCYRIQSIEGPNVYGQGATAFSNISCITREPLVWIPTAMVYQGVNNEFKPVLGFIDFSTYEMEIYNKWGEMLFKTNEADSGWDGTYNGQVVPEDYYRYIISFNDGGGKPFVEEGTMYMVRNAE